MVVVSSQQYVPDLRRPKTVTVLGEVRNAPLGVVAPTWPTAGRPTAERLWAALALPRAEPGGDAAE
jgi:hypothetical protein